MIFVLKAFLSICYQNIFFNFMYLIICYVYLLVLLIMYSFIYAYVIFIFHTSYHFPLPSKIYPKWKETRNC